jgi:hypothetical protein
LSFSLLSLLCRALLAAGGKRCVAFADLLLPFVHFAFDSSLAAVLLFLSNLRAL